MLGLVTNEEFEDGVVGPGEDVVTSPVPTIDDEDKREFSEVPGVDTPGTDDEEFENVTSEIELKEGFDVLLPEVLLISLVERHIVVDEALPEEKGTEERWMLDALPDEVEVRVASQV